MADYNDKLNNFFDDDEGGEDEATRVFDTTGLETMSDASKSKKKPVNSKLKEELAKGGQVLDKGKKLFSDKLEKLKDKKPMIAKQKKPTVQTKSRRAKPEHVMNAKTPQVQEDKKQNRKETNAPEDDRPVRFRRDRHIGILGGVLYFVFVVGVSTLLACFGWLAATDVLALGKPETAIEITIPDEYDMDTITQILYDKGVIKYRSLFKFYGGLSSTPAEEKIKPGTYQLYTNYDYRAIVNGLTPAGGTRVSVTVTVPEGYTLRQMFNLLEERGVCTAAKLWDCAANYDFDYDFLDSSTLGDEKRLEGYLFPDTYDFYMTQDPEDVINKFLKNFNNRFSDDYMAKAEELGYSVKEILTVASLIEKEAAGEVDRSTIASVIYNRLRSDSFPYLQFDSTVNYIVSETGVPFDTEIDNPYNTYKYTGLPVGPIANPGKAAIEAALYPEDTNYYFYALDIYGEHQFFTNSDSFYAFINSSDYAG